MYPYLMTLGCSQISFNRYLVGMATSNRLTGYSFERPNIGYRFQCSITRKNIVHNLFHLAAAPDNKRNQKNNLISCQNHTHSSISFKTMLSVTFLTDS